MFAPLFGDPYATPVDGLTPTGLPLGVLTSGHLLGTDALGRDMLARVAFGARASLEIAFISNITSVGLGVIVGLVAGFYRGWVEHALMRITDVFLAVPTVISGLALASVFGTGVIGIVGRRHGALLGVDGRVVFGETLALRRRTFVEAAIAMGAPGRTVIRRHILPNLASLIADHRGVQRRDRGGGRRRALATSAPGIQPPTPEWGNMLAEGQGAIDYAPHLLIVPLACVVLIVLRLRADRRVARAPRRRLAPEVMARYLIVRIGLGLVTIAGVVLLTFVLQFSLPGDPARRIAGPRASPEVLATVRANLHLDDSVPSQLVTYVDGCRAGRSRRVVHPPPAGHRPDHGAPAGDGRARRRRPDGRGDPGRRRSGCGTAFAASAAAASRPRTWSCSRSRPTRSGSCCSCVFAYRLDLLPLGGGTSAKELILPAATLGLFGVPYYAAVVSESTRTAPVRRRTCERPWRRAFRGA